jgi:hypothetical protein
MRSLSSRHELITFALPKQNFVIKDNHHTLMLVTDLFASKTLFTNCTERKIILPLCKQYIFVFSSFFLPIVSRTLTMWLVFFPLIHCFHGRVVMNKIFWIQAGHIRYLQSEMTGVVTLKLRPWTALEEHWHQDLTMHRNSLSYGFLKHLILRIREWHAPTQWQM